MRFWHLSRRMLSAKWEDRAEGAKLLGELGDPRAVRVLMPVLRLPSNGR